MLFFSEIGIPCCTFVAGAGVVGFSHSSLGAQGFVSDIVERFFLFSRKTSGPLGMFVTFSDHYR